MRCLAALVAAAALLIAPSARGHELQPAFLEITETAPGLYDVLWRTPLVSGNPLPVRLSFPGFCTNRT